MSDIQTPEGLPRTQKNSGWMWIRRFRSIALALLILCLSVIPARAVEIKEGEIQEGGQEVEQVIVKQAVPEEVVKKLIEDLLTDDVIIEQVVGERPDPDGVPTKVKISIYVFDIAHIDDADQTFTVDFRLALRWLDPRLASNTEQMRQMPLYNVWNPLVGVENKRRVEVEREDDVFVDPDGRVFYFQVYNGDFTVPLNLRNFPLDKHKLYIQATSFYGPEDVQLIIDEKLTGWSEKLSIPDWLVMDAEAIIQTQYEKVQGRDMTGIQFSFKIVRHIGFYFWKIIVPLCIIVLMSWCVFWIDPTKLEAQIAVAVTAILTLFAFQFVVASILPRAQYLTRMDKFILLSTVLIFFALVEALLTGYLARKENIRECMLIDHCSRVIFPLSFAAILAYSFYL